MMSPRNRKKKTEVYCDVVRPSTRKKDPMPKQEPKKKDDDPDWVAETRKARSMKTYANKKKGKVHQKQEATAKKSSVSSPELPPEPPLPTYASTMYETPVTTTPYTQMYQEQKHANVLAWVNSNPYARVRTPSPLLLSSAPSCASSQPRSPVQSPPDPPSLDPQPRTSTSPALPAAQQPLPRQRERLRMSVDQGFALYKIARIVAILEDQLVEIDKERKSLTTKPPDGSRAQH